MSERIKELLEMSKEDFDARIEYCENIIEFFI